MTVATVPQPARPVERCHSEDATAKPEHPPSDDELATTASNEKTSLEGPYSRLLGDTEHNWCRAVGSGTGITVLSLLFSHAVDVPRLQEAVDLVQTQHPRLRSHLVWIQGRPAFKVSEGPYVRVEVIDATAATIISEEKNEEEQQQGSFLSSAAENVANSDLCTAELQDKENQDWMAHVETELNMNLWPERQHCLEPTRMLVVRLYLLPQDRSLVVLRLHTAICDRVAAATVLADILKALRSDNCSVPSRETRFAQGTVPENPPQQLDSSCPDREVPSESGDCTSEISNLMSVEDAIPPGKANKPFWAHGIDLLGYSLGTRRHALLPFHEPNAPRCSKFFHSVLTVQHTNLLLKECERRNTSVYGALSAAGLKAAAAVKAIGKRSEHFAIVTLVDCRQLLQPELPDSTVGFYHSALMNTHHVNEQTDFWELAKRSTGALEDAMRNRKHFTDMGDLNYLMFQALQHPALTPSSSMRTSLLVLFRDPVVDEMEELADALGVEHYVGCSSIHGVGPSLAIFDSIRKGALHFTGVYATPLYSRTQMLTYVKLLVGILVGALTQ